MKVWIIGILFCVVTFCCYAESNSKMKIPQILEKIPLLDQKKIEFFFSTLLDHDFAYTIFGSKPVSLADFYEEISAGENIPRYLELKLYSLQIFDALRTWEKYQHLFFMPHYVFVLDEKDLYDCGTIVLLINKKEFIRIFNENRDIFIKESGLITAEKMIEDLDAGKKMSSLIKKNYGLLGILLGYGTRNATLFQTRYSLWEESEKRKFLMVEDNPYMQECNRLRNFISNFNEFEEGFPLIKPLYFAADFSDPETLKLKKKYSQEQISITTLLSSGNFLEVILNKLCESEI